MPCGGYGRHREVDIVDEYLPEYKYGNINTLMSVVTFLGALGGFWFLFNQFTTKTE